MLVKAARPGRMRGVAVEVFAAARARPDRAGPTLREGSASRALHSRERRLVRDALFGMVRFGSRWAHAVGDDDPLALWLAALVVAGLPAEVAAAERPAPFQRLADPDGALAGLPTAARLAARHGVPEPVVRRWLDRHGDAGCAALLDALDTRAPIGLRVNRRRATPERVVAALAAEGISAKLGAAGLRVDGEARVTETAPYRDGWFEVQDDGSQRLAELVPAGARVVDLCAGAGGKSLALADRGHAVLAADVRGGALAELSRRAQRAGVRVPTVALAAEGALPAAVVAFGADAVLVDAPCTGSGVLRRHPEHRWVLDEARIAAKAEVQRAILARAAAIVPPGGVLVYATCSLLDDENAAVVRSFLADHPEFTADASLELAPHTSDTDGFFGQRLLRSASLHSTGGRPPR